MKKIFLYAAALVAMATGCNKINNEPSLDVNEPAPVVKMITETVSGSRGFSTKATIADADASFKWSVGDNIAVHVDGTAPKYVFTSDAGAAGASVADATASFTVVYEDGYSRDAFAVYPGTIVSADAANYGQSGTPLDVTLPASYTLAEVTGETTPCPMIATNEAGSEGDFYQLCGLLRLTVSSIPAGAKRLEICFDGKKVSGDFSIASPVTPGSSVIPTADDASHDTITIIKDGTDVALGEESLVLNIPLPAGEYANIIVVAYDAITGGKPLYLGNVSFSYTASNEKGVKKAAALNTLPKSTFRFTFENQAVVLGNNLRFVRLFSCQNKLYNSSTTYGPFTVSGDTDMSNLVSADLLFDNNDGDQLAFQVVVADGKVYSGILDAPAGGFKVGKNYDLTVNVNLYTFTVASGKKVYFSPGDLGLEIVGGQSVYSFTEPFTDWGHGNTTNYNDAATAASKITKRVWFDFYFESGLATGTVYGITEWKIPIRGGTTVASYWWNYIVDSRTMNSGVERSYKVTIPGHQYCLLLPPDETLSTDIGEDLTSGNVTDYAKYLGKGFVLLFNTNRGIYSSNKWSWGSSTSSYAKQGWYWTVYNNSNRYYFTWPDAGPKVDWGANRMRNHIRYVREVQ